MANGRDDYWQEAFEIAMDEVGCNDLLAQMSKEQREEIGGALAGSAECVGMALPTPPNPLLAENKSLERKLVWERELEKCDTCNGRGRLIENFGPWQSSSECYKCHGAGRVHPRGEREPA